MRRELDGIKKRGDQLSKAAQDSLRTLLKWGQEEQRLSVQSRVLRMQTDDELFHDKGFHLHPHSLRADDSIHNCTRYFRDTLGQHVVLLTNDVAFSVLANANRIPVCSPACIEHNGQLKVQALLQDLRLPVEANPLRSGWKQVMDPVTRRIYYWHNFTGKSQWEKPEEEEDNVFAWEKPELMNTRCLQ